MEFPLKKIAIAGIFCLLTGCSHVEQLQQQAMDDYRSTLKTESEMLPKMREQLYMSSLWYNPALWEKQSSQSTSKKAQETERAHTFLECLKIADAIEAGISEQIGGRDPIQMIHARANVEVCMISNDYQAINKETRLICEADESDVLPVCLFARREVLNYR